MQEVQWIFFVMFWTWFLPNQMALVPNQLAQQNLSLSRQEVPELSFDRFLVVVFATRVLQNDMFCQALGTEMHFRGRSVGVRSK